MWANESPDENRWSQAEAAQSEVESGIGRARNIASVYSLVEAGSDGEAELRATAAHVRKSMGSMKTQLKTSARFYTTVASAGDTIRVRAYSNLVTDQL